MVRLFDVIAAVIHHGTDFSVGRTADHGVANPQRTILNQYRGDRAAPFIEFCLDNNAAGIAIRIGLQLFHFGNQQNIFQQIIDTQLLLGRHGNHDGVTAVFFRNQSMLHEFLLDVIRICSGLIDLIDGYNNGNLGRFGMIDRLNRLGHNAVIGSHDKNRNIRNLGTACTHCRKRFMARCVKEYNFLPLQLT